MNLLTSTYLTFFTKEMGITVVLSYCCCRFQRFKQSTQHKQVSRLQILVKPWLTTSSKAENEHNLLSCFPGVFDFFYSLNFAMILLSIFSIFSPVFPNNLVCIAFMYFLITVVIILTKFYLYNTIFLSIYKMLYSRILELIHLALTEFLSKRIKNQDLIEILLSPCSLLTIADMCKQLVHWWMNGFKKWTLSTMGYSALKEKRIL